MKKNQFTRWLQNKTVLAALLMVLLAGTAVAGITATRRSNPEPDAQKDPSGYAFETQEAENEQLAVPTQPEAEKETEAETPAPTRAQGTSETTARETEEKPTRGGQATVKREEPETEAEPEDGTLVDAGDAVVYTPEDEEAEAAAGANGTALLFQEGSHITWPVEGNVILDYSMDSTIYFPTLKQYKCNPGILIQSEVGMPVEAAVRGMVTAIGSDEELGNFVIMDLGGDYTVLYGQLADVTVAIDQLVEAGEVLGYVAEPTKYYVVEGPNMYLELRHQGTPVDPLDYIR